MCDRGPKLDGLASTNQFQVDRSARRDPADRAPQVSDSSEAPAAGAQQHVADQDTSALGPASRRDLQYEQPQPSAAVVPPPYGLDAHSQNGVAWG
jgi:hypothetical protein